MSTRVILQAGKSQRAGRRSLLFRTSRTTELPQSIYEVQHDEMRSYNIFPGAGRSGCCGHGLRSDLHLSGDAIAEIR